MKKSALLGSFSAAEVLSWAPGIQFYSFKYLTL